MPSIPVFPFPVDSTARFGKFPFCLRFFTAATYSLLHCLICLFFIDCDLLAPPGIPLDRKWSKWCGASGVCEHLPRIPANPSRSARPRYTYNACEAGLWTPHLYWLVYCLGPNKMERKAYFLFLIKVKSLSLLMWTHSCTSFTSACTLFSSQTRVAKPMSNWRRSWERSHYQLKLNLYVCLFLYTTIHITVRFSQLLLDCITRDITSHNRHPVRQRIRLF